MTGAVSVRNRSRGRAGAVWIAGAWVGLVGGYATLVVDPGLIIPDLLAVLALALARPRLLGVVGAIVGMASSGRGCSQRLKSTAIPACCQAKLHAARRCRFSPPTTVARWPGQRSHGHGFLSCWLVRSPFCWPDSP